jgi:hypothetical protein
MKILLSTLVAAAVAAGVAGAAVQQPSHAFWTTGRVTGLAADGNRVAIGTTALKNACDRVIVWNPFTRANERWATRTNCGAGTDTSGGQALREVALAGTRVAWLESISGNNQELTLRTATLSRPSTRDLVFAVNGNGAGGDPTGQYVGETHGDGDLLAFRTWTVCAPDIPNPPCSQPKSGAAPTLWRATATSKAQVTKAAGTLVAVDAGRLAVRSGVEVTLFDSAGHVVRTIATTPGAGGTALNGTQLATVDGSTLSVYSTTTGTLTKTIALPRSGKLLDLQSGIALVQLGDRELRVVRISDGRDRVLATAASTLAGGQLESAGAWYAWNVRSGKTLGRVAFLSWTQVLAKLR